MSLYNMMFGANPVGPTLLATLGLSMADFGRYRDAFVAGGRIVVYTRCGGGNRESYQDVFDLMSAHPCYERDVDDDFDSTYASFFFRFPEEFAEDLKKLDSGEPWDPSARWAAMLESLKSRTP